MDNGQEYLKHKIFVGLVEDNKDPLRKGRIKIRVQGVFDEIDINHIPWAHPFNRNSGREFSAPAEGKIVNVIFNNGNIKEIYYIFAENYNINLLNKMKDLSDDEYQNFVSLLFDHTTQIYKDNGALTMDYFHNSIKIKKNDIDIRLKDNSQKLNLGHETADQSAVLGDHWLQWFDEFVTVLLEPSSLTGNLAAPILKPKLDALLLKYQAIRQMFLSQHVKIVDNQNCLKSNIDREREDTPTMDDFTEINNQKPLNSPKISNQAKDNIKNKRQNDIKEQEDFKPNPKDVTIPDEEDYMPDEETWQDGDDRLKKIVDSVDQNDNISDALKQEAEENIEVPETNDPYGRIWENENKGEEKPDIVPVGGLPSEDKPMTGEEYDNAEAEKEQNINEKTSGDPYSDFWSGRKGRSANSYTQARESENYGLYVDSGSEVGNNADVSNLDYNTIEKSKLPDGWDDDKIKKLISSAIRRMKQKNYIVYTKRWKLNLVGIRTPINTNINKFNDWLLVFWWENDVKTSNDIENVNYKLYKITTVPGLNVRKKPTNSIGVGWLVENQYVDSYILSFHKINDPDKKYVALRQSKGIFKAYRSNGSSNGVLKANKISGEEINYMNIHKSSYKKNPAQWGKWEEEKTIGAWSEGCQVFARTDYYWEFISICAESKKQTNVNKFTYTILLEKDLIL